MFSLDAQVQLNERIRASRRDWSDRYGNRQSCRRVSMGFESRRDNSPVFFFNRAPYFSRIITALESESRARKCFSRSAGFDTSYGVILKRRVPHRGISDLRSAQRSSRTSPPFCCRKRAESDGCAIAIDCATCYRCQIYA